VRISVLFFGFAVSSGVLLALDLTPPYSGGSTAAEERKPEEVRHVLLEGQVTDHIGAGHADVAIALSARNEDGTAGETIAQTTTNALGDFILTAANPLSGRFVVTVSKKGFAPIVRELTLQADEPAPFLAEELVGVLSITGTVVDHLSDKPIPRAAVTIRSNFREDSVATDEEGRFRSKGWSAGSGRIGVEAEGYGRESRPFSLSEAADETVVDVRLKPERIVRLTVVDTSDQPVSGASLEVYDPRTDDFRHLVSDAEGSAMLKGVHFDTQSLSVRLAHEDFVSAGSFDGGIELDPQSRESTHRLVMVRAGSIAGVVTDAATGKPLHGVRLVATAEPSDDAPRDWSDEQGNFNIRGVAPGPSVVTIYRPGFAPELRTLEVASGQSAELPVSLHPALSLKGIVKDSKGQPVKGALLFMQKWRDHAILGLRAMTDRDGVFVMENAPRDEFEVAISARGFGTVSRVVKAGNESPLEFVLEGTPEGSGTGDLPVLRVGQTVPDVLLIALDGSRLETGKPEAKVLLLDFWATWCGPCVAEVENLRNVHKRFGARKDFRMVGISLDDELTFFKEFIKSRGIEWSQVFGEGARSAAQKFGVSGIPAVFLIGRDGKLLAQDLSGPGMADEVSKFLDPADAGPAENRP
jgi:thiol-disulfide isomerase/thioredoxin